MGNLSYRLWLPFFYFERIDFMKNFFLGCFVATTTLIGTGSVYLLMQQYIKQRRYI